MKKVFKASLMLLAGLMLFASCKPQHQGLPKKGSNVELTVKADGETVTAELPIYIYDVYFESAKSMAEKIAAKKPVSEKVIDKLHDDIGAMAYGNPADVLSEKEMKDFEKFVKSLSDKQSESVMKMINCLNHANQIVYETLSTVNSILNKESWGFKTVDDYYKYIKEDEEDYKMVKSILASLYPKIEFAF